MVRPDGIHAKHPYVEKHVIATAVTIHEVASQNITTSRLNLHSLLYLPRIVIVAC